MKTQEAHAVIDTYALEDCVVILAAYAPDLYEKLREASASGTTGEDRLTLARKLAKQAYDREKKLS